MTSEEITQQKDIAYYTSSTEAWYNSSLERDKSLLNLSAGGIGLLITLLTAVGPSSAVVLILYIAALVSFVVTLIAVLTIFQHNKKYIEDIINQNATDNSRLAILDSFAFWAFLTGVIFTAIIGITAATDSLTLKEQLMRKEGNSNKTITQTSPRPANPHTTICQNSYNGATALQPRPPASSESSSAATPSGSPTSSGGSNTQVQSNDK